MSTSGRRSCCHARLAKAFTVASTGYQGDYCNSGAPDGYDNGKLN